MVEDAESKYFLILLLNFFLNLMQIVNLTHRPLLVRLTMTRQKVSMHARPLELNKKKHPLRNWPLKLNERKLQLLLAAKLRLLLKGSKLRAAALVVAFAQQTLMI